MVIMHAKKQPCAWPQGCFHLSSKLKRRSIVGRVRLTCSSARSQPHRIAMLVVPRWAQQGSSLAIGHAAAPHTTIRERVSIRVSPILRSLLRGTIKNVSKPPPYDATNQPPLAMATARARATVQPPKIRGQRATRCPVTCAGLRVGQLGQSSRGSSDDVLPDHGETKRDDGCRHLG